MRIIGRELVSHVCTGEGRWYDLYVGELGSCSYYGSGSNGYGRYNIDRHEKMYLRFFDKIKRNK